MNLNSRLSALEHQQQEVESKGYRVVTECTGGYFGEAPSGALRHYPNADGSAPEGAPFYTREDIEAMKADGWNVIIIRYDDDWRGEHGTLTGDER